MAHFGTFALLELTRMDRKMLRDDHWKRIEPLCAARLASAGDGARQSPLCRSSVVDRPHGLAVA